MTDDISGKKIGWLKAGILATSNGPARQMTLSLLPPAPRAENQRVLRLRQVCAATGLRRSFIYQLQAQDRLRASGFKIPKLDGGWA